MFLFAWFCLFFHFSVGRFISPNIEINAIPVFLGLTCVWETDTRNTGIEKRYPGKNYVYNSQVFCDFSVLKASKIMVKNLYNDILFRTARFARSH